MKDIKGNVYGKLTVVDVVGQNKHGSFLWKCKCDCGNYTTTTMSLLESGKTKSCGCLIKETARKNFTTHGLRNHPLYVVWYDMRRRCEKTTDKRYIDYGGRGITVCKEWSKDFKAFYDWAMANGYQKGLTIDRIDNNGNYEPSNCRWVDRYVQANNKRNNRIITINGTSKTLIQWCREYNIKPATVINRIKRGWSEKEAVTEPLVYKKRGLT